MTIQLEVESRESGKTPAGKVAGVVYGPKQEPVTLSLEPNVFEKTLREAGESTILTLTGLSEDIDVLIHDVTFDPVKGGVQHVDFYAIEKGKELTTNVAIHFEGEAPIVDTEDAVVNKILHEVEVTCKPQDLPSYIEVDLSVLTELDSQIHVKDLKVGSGITISNDPDDLVAVVTAVAEEPEADAAGEVDMDAIEVEGKGKEEDAEGGASEAEQS